MYRLGSNVTCEILDEAWCTACGWPVIDACANFTNVQTLFPGEDYVMYCTNKGCEHHAGEGYLQSEPDWVQR